MNKWLINSLLWLVALGWAAPVMAQYSLKSPVLVGEPTTIYSANIPRKLLWAFTTLMNPDYEYRQIPLYAYPKLKDNEFLRKALSEATKGNVHIAAVRDSGDFFSAIGIHTSDNVTWCDIQNILNETNNAKCPNTDTIWSLAFTRPLDLKIKKDEYLTTPKLWDNLVKSKPKQ